jgi:hypothetical protein
MCSRVKPKTEPNNQLLQEYQLFVLFFLFFLFSSFCSIQFLLFFAAIKAICVISLTKKGKEKLSENYCSLSMFNIFNAYVNVNAYVTLDMLDSILNDLKPT